MFSIKHPVPVNFFPKFSKSRHRNHLQGIWDIRDQKWVNKSAHIKISHTALSSDQMT